jgi:hypothetical protein
VLDRCGVTLLAGKAVGAPFVGAVAACLAVSEVLRLLNGGRLYQLVDLDLQSIEHRIAVAQQSDFSRLNPGFLVVPAANPSRATSRCSSAKAFGGTGVPILPPSAKRAA